jgi:hypothetical protein
MKRIIYIIALFVITSFAVSSCVGDLNVEPIDPNVSTANNVFKDEAAYKQALAKIYSSYALSGQTGGGGGNPDIAGIDEGFGNYLRLYWDLQELSTDEAIMAWDDATIKSFHWQTWAASDVFLAAMYSRIFYTVSIANEFVRVTNTALGSATGDFATNLGYYQAEARFLRAFSYWHAIDMFGNVPFVTEADLPGAYSPKRIERADLFKYIESELLDLETKLPDPKMNEYGRVDKAAVWMLLSELYINAKVYANEDKNTEALTYINKVISSGYSIDPNYKAVFAGDNNNSPEIIFPICFDGLNTQQYGGMTFILHATNGGGMPANGVDGGWGGIRGIKEFAAKFGVTESDFSAASPELKTNADKRVDFYFNPDNWNWEVENVGTFTDGIGINKFSNLTAAGGAAQNADPTFASTDFPVFRLADAYLMYAEAVLRGGAGGDINTAVGYINQLQQRAFGNATHNVTSSTLTLDFILDERARELYWEGHRRTDLIRFGKFTGGDYIWTWKGNVQAGTATSNYRDLFPIPLADLNANPNLIQNDGY